jgi:hypothetical protein
MKICKNLKINFATIAILSHIYYLYEVHTIAQAVSRWLPTTVAQVQARVWQVGFVVDNAALGQVFSEYFSFPCQSSFHQILHHHNHLGQVQYASTGRRDEWTQYGLHPPLCEFKKI